MRRRSRPSRDPPTTSLPTRRLSRLEASRLLPVEYGTVTSTSIVGGLVVYQEHRFVPSLNLWMMGTGTLA